MTENPNKALLESAYKRTGEGISKLLLATTDLNNASMHGQCAQLAHLVSQLSTEQSYMKQKIEGRPNFAGIILTGAGANTTDAPKGAGEDAGSASSTDAETSQPTPSASDTASSSEPSPEPSSATASSDAGGADATPAAEATPEPAAEAPAAA